MTSSSIDPLIPTTLVDALKQAFSVQISTPVEIKGAKAIPPTRISGIDLTAVIGIRSSALTGSIALCFPSRTFLGVVNQMLGEKYEKIDRENQDAAGELLNILYGSARVKLNQAGYDFAPAIPTVVLGSEIQISHGNSPLMIKIDCECSYGPFHLEVSLRKQ